MDNGDPRFPSSRYLRVPFIFVPKGRPPPLEWMREHADHITVSGFYTPPTPPEPNMGLEPQPGAEGQAEPSPETPIYLVDFDASGRWAIARPVPPLTPRPAPQTEPPSTWPQKPEPAGWQSPIPPADPPPRPMLDPHLREPRPDDPASRAPAMAETRARWTAAFGPESGGPRNRPPRPGVHAYPRAQGDAGNSRHGPGHETRRHRHG
jgi:hypothetical protein